MQTGIKRKHFWKIDYTRKFVKSGKSMETETNAESNR